jgi:hypothetical protein
MKDFHLPNDAALKTLIELFYNSIVNNAPLPLSYGEILLTSKIMDDIFSQIKCMAARTTIQGKDSQ